MKITADSLREAFYHGYQNLLSQKAYVDKLNVFPVPDGDTGTNMTLTLKSAVEQLEKIESPDFESIAAAITKGSLMGARGNSGVILSQILRGFGKSIEDKDALGPKELAYAFEESKKVSYKAVIKPVEGTILTVISEISGFALVNCKKYSDTLKFFEDMVKAGNKALKNTPELLKELKEAGVVDSGGQGLMFFLEGMLASFKGEKLSGRISLEDAHSDKLFETDVHIFDKEPENGYCTEFILNTDKIGVEELKAKLNDLGDSMVAVGYDGIIKIHIHTNNPGQALEIACKYGDLERIKIDNMRLEFRQRIGKDRADTGSKPNSQAEKPENKKKFAVISVSTGQGLADIMMDFGVDVIISGGQTMNPSAGDFVKAAEETGKEKIIIFPNNSNIIMAANQAKDMSDKNIAVIPTKNIPQCFQALLSLNPAEEFDKNVSDMMDSFAEVKSGQVTYAVRDTNIDGKDIKKGDYIGLNEKTIISSSKTIDEAVIGLVNSMVTDGGDIITLFYGEGVDVNEAQKLANKVKSKYNNFEVELYDGGQKVYNYLISVE